jgi:hypothetical protein
MLLDAALVCEEGLSEMKQLSEKKGEALQKMHLLMKS